MNEHNQYHLFFSNALHLFSKMFKLINVNYNDLLTQTHHQTCDTRPNICVVGPSATLATREMSQTHRQLSSLPPKSRTETTAIPFVFLLLATRWEGGAVGRYNLTVCQRFLWLSKHKHIHSCVCFAWVRTMPS